MKSKNCVFISKFIVIPSITASAMIKISKLASIAPKASGLIKLSKHYLNFIELQTILIMLRHFISVYSG